MEDMNENAHKLTNKTLAFVDTIDGLESERKNLASEDTTLPICGWVVLILQK